MKDISKLKIEAEKAIEKLVSGKTYTTKYALDRINKALDKSPNDVLIGTMRDAVEKYARKNPFITQKKIGSLYDHLCGFSHNKGTFRDSLEDLLPSSNSITPDITKGAAGSRMDHTGQLPPLIEDSELSRELSGVFSLDSGPTIPNYNNNTLRRAEKFAKAQLDSIGHPPINISAVRSNNHFVLCNAIYKMANHDTVSVAIPVGIHNGAPSLPDKFIKSGSLIDLNKDSLFLHLKESQHELSESRSQSDLRRTSSIELGPVKTPAALEDMIRIDDALIVAASNFSKDQVKMASNVIVSELSGYGVVNPQVSVSSATDSSIIFSADIPTKKGRLEVSIPVEMINGQPILPSSFTFGKTDYDFSGRGFGKFSSDISVGSDKVVSRQVKEMNKQSYHDLIDSMIDGVSSGNLRMAEDALATIGGKFELSQYKAALDKFSKLLKHSSKGSERDKMIKSALKSGDLIVVPTSVEPYCPKLGLPASKVAFDDKGRIIPARKKSKSDNLDDSGAMMSSYNISIS
jgi:hypothetical protein